MKLSSSGSGSAADYTCRIPLLIPEFVLLSLPALSPPFKDMVYINRNVSFPLFLFPSFHMKINEALNRETSALPFKNIKNVRQIFSECSTS